jgi:hypothetical protein
MQQRIFGNGGKRPPLVTRAGALLLAITLAVGVYTLGYTTAQPLAHQLERVAQSISPDSTKS